MAAHNELGKEGEDEAVRYLETKGYRICHRNWRSGRKELDIVAEHQGELIVVEVRTRRNQTYGTPEESISEAKIRRIVSSADAYVRKFCIDSSSAGSNLDNSSNNLEKLFPSVISVV